MTDTRVPTKVVVRDVDIAGRIKPTTRVRGWCLGDLAVTPSDVHGLWTITHLPSGFALRSDGFGDYRTRAKAIAAMREMQPLSKDWNFRKLSKRENERLRDECMAIAVKHGAVNNGLGTNQGSYNRAQKLNGYAA